MSIWKNGKLVAGGRQTTPLLSFMWADHILDDISWLRADTFSWQNGAVYQAVYQHLADDIDGKSLQSETVAGTTIQFYVADDGHKICPASEESNVAAIYSATGVAWYYVIDTTNERFKLPRRHSQQIVRSVKNADGSWYRLYADGWVEQGGVSEGLNTVVTLPIEMADTNYTLVCSGVYASRTNANGANWSGTSGDKTSTTIITLGQAAGFPTMGWQVSGQSAIDMSSFQDSEKHLYFYVGEFTQTAIENTAGLNAELFNGKADITSILPMVSPDYANAVTVTATTTEQSYTCPGYGFVVVDLAGFNGGYCYLKINGVTMFNKTTSGNSSLIGATGQYMVSAGDVCLFKDGYANAESFAGTCKFMFIPCKGVN